MESVLTISPYVGHTARVFNEGDLHIPSNFKGDLTAAVRISKNKGARMFLKERWPP